MVAQWVAIIVAFVGAGGPLTVVLTRLERRNTDQHERSLRQQERVFAEVSLARQDIGVVQQRLDRHLEFHATPITR